LVSNQQAACVPQKTRRQFLAIADDLFGADWADSRHYRFGASSLLASLLKALGHGDGKSASSY
jgi:deoxyribose-phosphate aldolase